MKWNSRYMVPDLGQTEGMSNIRLGTNLKTLLRSRGLSLKEVSVKTGIPYSTLHTWLENRQPKDILKVKRLADFLEVGLHFLLFSEEETASTAPTPELPTHNLDEMLGTYEVVVRKLRK